VVSTKATMKLYFKNKRAQRALERSPESEDFKEFPFFIALYTTGDTWGSTSEVMFKQEGPEGPGTLT